MVVGHKGEVAGVSETGGSEADAVFEGGPAFGSVGGGVELDRDRLGAECGDCPCGWLMAARRKVVSAGAGRTMRECRTTS